MARLSGSTLRTELKNKNQRLARKYPKNKPLGRDASIATVSHVHCEAVFIYFVIHPFSIQRKFTNSLLIDL